MLNIGDDERAMVARLFAELRAVLTRTGDDPDVPLPPFVRRLFPTAYPDDEQKEAEYQRLMRDDLVASRVAQIDIAAVLLASDAPDGLDEAQVIGLMQSINAVRVVLGTMLDVGENDDEDLIDPDDEHAAEAHLYGYLSWLLDWTVRSMH